MTWRSFGPGATFPYIQKVSPAIPVLRAVKEAFAAQFPAIRGRGKRHGTPSKADDVKKLVSMYQAAKAHKYVPNMMREGRNVLLGTNRADDFITKGAGKLVSGDKFRSWWDDRSFDKATTQIYSMNETD